MHPLLQTRRRLGLYLLAWTPLAALLGVVAWASGPEPPLSLALELTPACALMAKNADPSKITDHAAFHLCTMTASSIRDQISGPA